MGDMEEKESFDPLDILVKQRIRSKMVGYFLCGSLILGGLLSWQFMSLNIFLGFIVITAAAWMIYSYSHKKKMQKKIKAKTKKDLEKIWKGQS